MSFSSLGPLLFGASLALLISCGSSKKSKEEGASPPGAEATCETNSDCEAGWVCLDGTCANSASGAIYTDPSHAVTPDKVRRQVEKINENAQKRADKILEGL